MMNNAHMSRAFKATAMALAVAASLGARAADDEIDEFVYRLIAPESSVALGLGYLFDDNAARFGQYTGLNQNGISLTANADIRHRDDETGTWWLISGHDLGRDSRDLRIEHTRQGQWSYFLELAELTRHSQYRVNTGLSGLGTAALTVNGGPMRDIDPETRRQSVTVGYGQTLPAGWDVSIRFKNEEKDGIRLFGRGTPGNQQWLAEPIDQTMQQLDVIVGFTGERFQMQTGYYGSYFLNRHSGLAIDDPAGDPTNARDIASFSPMGLPPDNYAHQVYFTGGYNFTRTTRGTFKLSRTRATQQDRFIVAPAATVSGDNLDGQVDTTLLQAGVTARPMPALSLLANLRYMNRDDRTPVQQYFSQGGSTYDGRNEPRSVKSKVGKLEATYRVGRGYSVVGGLDYESRERNTSPLRVVSFREETDETTVRLALRKMMSETANGTLQVQHATRDGSDFQTSLKSDGTEGSNLVAPIHLADREQDKVRFLGDWTPTRSLSLQGMVEYSRERYDGREMGPRDGDAQLVSLDVSYAINDFWKATAWGQRSDTRLDQMSQSGGDNWTAKTRYQDRAFGVGLRGTINYVLEVGLDISESHSDGLFLFSSESSDIESVPDVGYQTQTVKLFGRYKVQPDFAVQLDVVGERWKTNDWQWADYVYSDGTTLSQDSDQNVLFIGLTGIVTWR